MTSWGQNVSQNYSKFQQKPHEACDATTEIPSQVNCKQNFPVTWELSWMTPLQTFLCFGIPPMLTSTPWTTSKPAATCDCTLKSHYKLINTKQNHSQIHCWWGGTNSICTSWGENSHLCYPNKIPAQSHTTTELLQHELHIQICILQYFGTRSHFGTDQHRASKLQRSEWNLSSWHCFHRQNDAMANVSCETPTVYQAAAKRWLTAWQELQGGCKRKETL